MAEYERLPKIISQVKGLTILTSLDLVTIEASATSLTLDLCLEQLMLERNELTDYELWVIDKIYKRGRANGIQRAGDSLFASMNGKQGGQHALEYLAKMSGEFSSEVTLTASSGFNFNVIIPE